MYNNPYIMTMCYNAVILDKFQRYVNCEEEPVVESIPFHIRYMHTQRTIMRFLGIQLMRIGSKLAYS